MVNHFENSRVYSFYKDWAKGILSTTYYKPYLFCA